MNIETENKDVTSDTSGEKPLPLFVPITVGVLVIAGLGVGIHDTLSNNFDYQAKTQLYSQIETLGLNAVATAVLTCPAAAQSTALAYLTIADSRQTNALQTIYEGDYIEENSSFKYYQRVPHAAATPRIVGSAEEMQYAIDMLESFANNNIVLTSQLVDTDETVRATFYVPQNEDAPMELTYAIEDSADHFFVNQYGLTQQEWRQITTMQAEGQFSEPGLYHIYNDLATNSLAYQRAEQVTNTPLPAITDTFGRQLMPLSPICRI